MLVMLCLFRECGVSDNVISGIGDSMNIQFLRRKLVVLPGITSV